MDSIKSWLPALVLLTCLGACKPSPSSPEPATTLPHYFPLAENAVWRWEVRDTLFTESDTLARHWVETDSVRKPFFGQNGVEIFPVDVYQSDSPTDSLPVFQNRNALYRSGNFWFEQSNNQVVAFLPVPVLIGTTWDAHAFNPSEPEMRTLTSMDYSWTTYSNCLLVQHLPSNTSLVDQFDLTEIYAPETGLVYSRRLMRRYSYPEGSPVLTGGSTREKIRIPL